MSRLANFDPLARVYRWMEWASFGPWLWRCRCAFLGELGGCRRALVLGDGDGRFTARLLRSNPCIQVDAVDASQAMLRALLRHAEPHDARVRTEVADVRVWKPSGTTQTQLYDMVVTHFFLDCLTTDEVSALAATLRPVLAGNAVWVVSEFAVPARGLGRLIARLVISCLYRAFGWMTGLAIRRLPDHHSALEQEGFVLRRSRSWLNGLLVSEIWSAKTSD